MTADNLPVVYETTKMVEPAGPFSPSDLTRNAERLAVAWLHGMVNPNTRNAYAIDIGLSAPLRAALPGGPRHPKPLPPEAWIPWAVSNGIDPAGELDTAEVEKWVHLLDDLYPRTKSVRKRRFAALCSFYRYLRRDKRVFCDPTDLLGGRQGRKNMGLSGADPHRTRPATEAQIRALFVAAQLDPTRHRARNRALLAVLTATGCRADELVSLDLEDYQRTSPTGHAMLLLDGKGGKKRWQVLPAADADLVDAYLAERIQPDGSTTELALVGQVSHRPRVEQPLFTTGRGRRLHVDSIQPLLGRIAALPIADDPRPAVRGAAYELASIKDRMWPHMFRHAYAATAANNGVSVRRIQEDLGHATLATTQSYLDSANIGVESGATVVSNRYHTGAVDLAAVRTDDSIDQHRQGDVD